MVRALVASLVALLLAAPAGAADTWSQPAPGLKRLHRTTSSQNANALVVDLCAAGVSLRATAYAERKRTVSSFGKLVGANAAVNGDFFSFSTYGTDGLSMSGGALWPGVKDHGYVAPVAIGAGQITIDHHNNTTAVQPWMKEIVSGHPTLLDDGAFVGNSGDPLCTNRHPRTAIGISKDHRSLILVVVDGRAPGRAGMTCAELATLLGELGAFDAVNLDGGGSSTMWLSASGVVNYPSDGSERTVANHLAVHAKGSGASPHCPGPPPSPELTIKLSLAPPSGQAADTCTAGTSKGIFDWTAGQESVAQVDVKNVGGAIAKNVEVSLWAEAPYLEILRWQILSDWQAGGGFKVNDVDAMQKVPRESPGASFKLWLGAFSPGETKRVELKVRAAKGSLADPVDHPDLRTWVAKIEGYYEKDDFWAAPKKNEGSLQKQNGGELRAFFQTDVLEPERCDGKDNDCDGQVDNGCSSSGEPGHASDATADRSSLALAVDGGAGDGATVGAGARPEESAGCSVAATPQASELLIVLLALALLRRSRIV